METWAPASKKHVRSGTCQVRGSEPKTHRPWQSPTVPPQVECTESHNCPSYTCPGLSQKAPSLEEHVVREFGTSTRRNVRADVFGLVSPTLAVQGHR